MTKTRTQAFEELAAEVDNGRGGTLAYTAPNGMWKNVHDQIMFILENYPEPETVADTARKPVLLTKVNGGDLWVFPEDVLRVEDARAMVPGYSSTTVYLRDGSERLLMPLTAAKAVETLWPGTTNKPNTDKEKS